MLRNIDDLAWQIILLLLDNGPLTAAEVDRLLTLELDAVHSSATVYRRIEHLEREQVLFRSRRKLILSLGWIEGVRALLSRVADSQSVSRNVSLLLPRREGEYQDFTAKSLDELDPIWNSFLIHIGSLPTERELVGFNARGWYPLALPEREKALYGALARAGVVTQLAVGGRTDLERSGTQKVSAPGLRIRCIEPLADSDDQVAWASSRYYLECHLPSQLTTEFVHLLNNVRDQHDTVQKKIEPLLHKKIPCRLRVYKSERRAREFREHIKQCA